MTLEPILAIMAFCCVLMLFFFFCYAVWFNHRLVEQLEDLEAEAVVLRACDEELLADLRRAQAVKVISAYERRVLDAAAIHEGMCEAKPGDCPICDVLGEGKNNA